MCLPPYETREGAGSIQQWEIYVVLTDIMAHSFSPIKMEVFGLFSCQFKVFTLTLRSTIVLSPLMNGAFTITFLLTREGWNEYGLVCFYGTDLMAAMDVASLKSMDLLIE